MDRSSTDAAIVRGYMAGKSYDEIGKSLGMSKTAVGVRIWTMRMNGVQLPESGYGRKKKEQHVEELNKLVRQLS
jgi:biotin operon repressor